MSPRSVLPILTAAALSALLIGCTPVTKYQGYTVLDESPQAAKVGEDNMNSVRTKFGSPTTISTFEPNIWYYMAQTTDNFGAYRPKLRARSIVAITFDKQNQKVADIRTFTAEDGRIIAYSSRETPTTGRELGLIEQLLSTIGSPLLPQQDADPGNLPGTIGR